MNGIIVGIIVSCVIVFCLYCIVSSILEDRKHSREVYKIISYSGSTTMNSLCGTTLNSDISEKNTDTIDLFDDKPKKKGSRCLNY